MAAKKPPKNRSAKKPSAERKKKNAAPGSLEAFENDKARIARHLAERIALRKTPEGQAKQRADRRAYQAKLRIQRSKARYGSPPRVNNREAGRPDGRRRPPKCSWCPVRFTKPLYQDLGPVPDQHCYNCSHYISRVYDLATRVQLPLPEPGTPAHKLYLRQCGQRELQEIRLNERREYR